MFLVDALGSHRIPDWDISVSIFHSSLYCRPYDCFFVLWRGLSYTDLWFTRHVTHVLSRDTRPHQFFPKYLYHTSDSSGTSPTYLLIPVRSFRRTRRLHIPISTFPRLRSDYSTGDRMSGPTKTVILESPFV